MQNARNILVLQLAKYIGVPTGKWADKNYKGIFLTTRFDVITQHFMLGKLMPQNFDLVTVAIVR